MVVVEVMLYSLHVMDAVSDELQVVFMRGCKPRTIGPEFGSSQSMRKLYYVMIRTFTFDREKYCEKYCASSYIVRMLTCYDDLDDVWRY